MSPVRYAPPSTPSAIWLEASDQQWESASALTHVVTLTVTLILTP